MGTSHGVAPEGVVAGGERSGRSRQRSSQRRWPGRIGHATGRIGERPAIFFDDAEEFRAWLGGPPREHQPSCGWASTRRSIRTRAAPGRRPCARRCAGAGSTRWPSASTRTPCASGGRRASRAATGARSTSTPSSELTAEGRMQPRGPGRIRATRPRGPLRHLRLRERSASSAARTAYADAARAPTRRHGLLGGRHAVATASSATNWVLTAKQEATRDKRAWPSWSTTARGWAARSLSQRYGQVDLAGVERAPECEPSAAGAARRRRPRAPRVPPRGLHRGRPGALGRARTLPTSAPTVTTSPATGRGSCTRRRCGGSSAKTQVVAARARRLRPQPADPLARGGADRPRVRGSPRLQRRRRRHRLPGPRPRPPAVRPQRRDRRSTRSPPGSAASRATPRRCAC